ncbi:hypothetical protein [Streptomyces broussonetiae]|uniref:FXSXX-COOH protein n=1 Tax=Streptomyces broussonetiae TaxID=2686304 RepID=A0A6I6N5M0_9ACTN|nr:hypothetical protein [Streptomyces broussonetiae]QHA06782.1 hypothetical protein GQF42_28955 [Streptomyces broussonetiae]
MAEQRKGAAGPGEYGGWAAFPPDLTDVDLRTLRAMDDPGLMAAVAGVLCRSREQGEVWYVNDDPPPRPPGVSPWPGDRTFPAGPGASATDGDDGG